MAFGTFDKIWSLPVGQNLAKNRQKIVFFCFSDWEFEGFNRFIFAPIRLWGRLGPTRVSQKLNCFLGPNSTKLGPIGLGCPSVRLSCRHRFLVRAVTFERKVVQNWFWAQIKAPIRRGAFWHFWPNSVNRKWSNWPKWREIENLVIASLYGLYLEH